ncbi:phosphate ABC transporter substrate-binding protein, PhoT family [Melioribacter roseus P3M-2]|uniref:Phosphate-binding protein n=1 Tax=Melioribacter roseus (strain DSM 23840 / JCM 17771 / VKM B-2668 / P3M-2) TaxID=1191523 RepID=I6Z9P9_MELRP|nr:phosphate ABC transporter substrate-binding protein PstS [Melioribacter roseus]AFN75870.1 phosphate ABC transporter substrate-binding protein, PhoT family [Melioribacter roseus P3M-2]
MYRKIIYLMMFMIAGLINLPAQVKLNGAGATFPYVIYSKWFDEFHKQTGVQINYQSIGSGGGIKQVIEGTVDFGASDGPMSDEQLKEAKAKQGTDVIHIPTVLGAVVLSYNLPEVKETIKLDGETIANIFLGKIYKWNDKRIAKLNPGVKLPNRSIIVVHRSDGSGTTFIFTHYLSNVSKEWAKKVGYNTSVNWPIGLGGKGNEGVAGMIKQTKGAIGYVELAYAVKNKLPHVAIKNRAGNFIEANFKTVSAASDGAAKDMPDDLRAMITNADGKDSYPISGFTWLLIYKDMKDQKKAEALVKFLKWALTKGESYAESLYYAPLPTSVVKLCMKKIDMLTVNGKPIKVK